MAFIHCRRGGKTYVYYHDSGSGKLRQVPRKLTKHLDGQPLHTAEEWVKQWEMDHGHVVDRAERINVKPDDKLLALWKQYQDFKDSDSDTPRRANTVAGETALFERYIVAFFVGKHGKKDPTTWHPLVPEFHSFLAEKSLSASSRQKVLWALKRFGESLVFTQHMSFPYAIRPPRSKASKVTPLKVRKTPEDIISFAKSTTYDAKTFRKGAVQFNLAVLLGYFGGFGPGELFALEKSDLITGDHAEAHCKTLPGFRKYKLGSRLGVVVNKTLPVSGKNNAPIPLMKNDYRYGVANIWDKDAAKLIASLVRDLPDGRLFPFSYGHLMRQWREQVHPKLKATPHDLRRASGLYLGRTVRVDLTLLQEHMRHAEIETTMLYCREPAVPEASKKKLVQDFSDVA